MIDNDLPPENRSGIPGIDIERSTLPRHARRKAEELFFRENSHGKPQRARRAATSTSFDNPVRGSEQPGLKGQAECLRGPQIDDEVELGGLLDRQLGGLGTLQYPVDVNGGRPPVSELIRVGLPFCRPRPLYRQELTCAVNSPPYASRFCSKTFFARETK